MLAIVMPGPPEAAAMLPQSSSSSHVDAAFVGGVRVALRNRR